MKRIFYSRTDGFDKYGYAAEGSVRGFGWEDIWVFAAGIEQRLTDRTKIRLGYNYGQCPIPSDRIFFNIPAPALVQHHVCVGLGYRLCDHAWLNVAYYHGFEESRSGPFHGPRGPIPGTRVKSELSVDSVSLGISCRF